MSEINYFALIITLPVLAVLSIINLMFIINRNTYHKDWSFSNVWYLKVLLILLSLSVLVLSIIIYVNDYDKVFTSLSNKSSNQFNMTVFIFSQLCGYGTFLFLVISNLVNNKKIKKKNKKV